MKILRIAALTVILLLAFPTAVYAQNGCSGIACWFNWDLGWTDRAQINADARVKIAEEETARAEQETRLQNERDARLLEINRAADTAIADAQSRSDVAQAQKDQFIAQVNSWRDIQQKAINADLDKSLAAIKGQTDIGLAAINQVGETKRWSLTTETIGWLAALTLIGVGLYLWTRRPQAPNYNINVFPDPRRRLPGHRQALPGHMQYPAVRYDDEDDDDYDEINSWWHQDEAQWRVKEQHMIEQKGGRNAITKRNGGEYW